MYMYIHVIRRVSEDARKREREARAVSKYVIIIGRWLGLPSQTYTHTQTDTTHGVEDRSTWVRKSREAYTLGSGRPAET